MDGEVRILHVDDNPEFVEASAQFLDRENDRFVVETATHPDEALETLNGERVDCIVSDYDMPEMNGIELYQAVREQSVDCPFVLFTGKGSEEIASDAFAVGVTDYLQKGVGTDQYTVLANRIRNAVEHYWSELEREWERKRYRKIFEATNDAVTWTEYDGGQPIIREANPVFRDLFEEPGTDVIGKSLDEVVAGPERREEAEEISRRVSTGEHLSGEFIRDTADGPRIFLWEVVPLEHPTKGMMHYTVYKDISELRDREQELERSYDLLQQTEELTASGGWEVDLETDEVRWTDGTYRIYDLSPEEFDPTVENATEFYQPEDQNRVEEAIVQCAKGGESIELEARLETAEGRFCWIRTTGEPIFEDGDIVAIRGAIQDITEHKERERELEELTGFRDAIIDSANSWINALDPEGNIILWNETAEEISGYTAEEVVGNDKIWELLYPDEEYREEILAGDQTIEGFETTIVTKSGEKRVISWNENPLFSDDELEGSVTIGRDITEHKRRKEQLEEFASVVSHDLRNPLNVAMLRLELAQQECDSEHLDTVARAHERMEALITDLLTLARQENIEFDPEVVELTSAVKESWSSVETRGATLDPKVDEQIRAEYSRFQQLMENLIRNAVEHGSTGNQTPSDDALEHSGESVTITVGTLDDGFYVEDDGPGIPADERDAVFETGYSTTREGTGIGLSIVTQIADAHDWVVDVTEGSTGGARIEIRDVEFV